MIISDAQNRFENRELKIFPAPQAREKKRTKITMDSTVTGGAEKAKQKNGAKITKVSAAR